ncbi:MAG: right-handed parallel beta-helix repeat-containing protein [Burkholderiales bacterium]|uniref:right-handed parallel beta-helix repeat-containing protein n=1 Tax=Inhella sp. TaxID=1921806 RepID=UPI001AD14005|nr:right-handed parallel beta-helix repeat-containing protein [Burkholderiales bacterium]
MNRFAPIALATALSLASTLAHAQTRDGDGVVNLNQTNATAGGVHATDAPGFPISIGTSGTYRLTSNLVVPAGQHGIEVGPNLHVVIDLNGFQIVGPAVCSKTQNCANYQTGGTVGVYSASETTNVQVRNGRVRGFSRFAIDIDGKSTSIVEDLHLENNYSGLRADNLLAQRVTVRHNSSKGIWMGKGQVKDSWAMDNGEAGILLDYRGRVVDTVMERNAIGLRVQLGVAMLAGTVFTENGTPVSGSVSTSSNLY